MELVRIQSFTLAVDSIFFFQYTYSLFYVVFVVPKTEDMVRTLFDPRVKKSFTDMLIVTVLVFYTSLYFILPPNWRVPVYAFLFAFWRLAYNGGIGWLLNQQSKYTRLTKFAHDHKLFDKVNENKLWHKILKHDLSSKLESDYDFYKAPLEYNTWLLFRHFVDLVLMSDFTNYILLAISCFSKSNQPILLVAGRWIAGISLFLFNLWVKLDAHRVVKDYAWYWGDFFFLEEIELTFDGVFELAPHPMYSIGYAGYYGICLMTASYTLFFASVLAHACQFVFLIFVENPHIEKTYNPTPVPKRKNTLESQASFKQRDSLLAESKDDSPQTVSNPKLPALLIFTNFQITRSSDVLTLLLAFYSVILVAVPKTTFWFFVTLLTAVSWRVFHNWGLGHILSSQSEDKGWTRLFLKYGKTPDDAYEQWQVIYNLSTIMSYISFFVVAIRQRESIEFVAYWPFKYIIGTMLIALQTWTSVSIYESLGEFGWFFGDFFYPEKAKTLTYSGIYRYLNNPERLFGISGVWGMALISGSASGYLVAFVWTIGSFYFIKSIEQPHMQKLYGNQIRAEAGLTKTIKRATEISLPLENTILIIQGFIDNLVKGISNHVETLLGHAKPKIQSGVKDTKTLLKEYPSKLTMVRLSDNLKDMDTSLYSLKVNGKTSGDIKVEFGTPIEVEWTADPKHSVRDWIGLYRVDENSSELVTNVSSRGHWSAVDETGFETHTSTIKVNNKSSGLVEFTGDALVWKTGEYQFRYHHDGKHNVVTISPKFSIVATPILADKFPELSKELLPIVQRIFTSSDYIPPVTINENWDLEEDVIVKRLVEAVQAYCAIDIASEVLASDQSVGQLALRIAQIKKFLQPFDSAK